MPRTRRLIIDPTYVVIEVGVGVQHRFAWSDCDAVLRFSDRLELVRGDTSVVIRASEWHRGVEALQLADRVAPSELRVEVAGEPEPPVIPYRLDGLARHSSVVLAVAAGSCIAMSIIAFTLSAPQQRLVGVIVGVLFLLPVRPLVIATRRRLAVPARWRQAALVAPGPRVKLDSALARMSNRNVAIVRVLAPAAGAAATVGWWFWTDGLAWFFLAIGGLIGGAAGREMKRRNHR